MAELRLPPPPQHIDAFYIQMLSDELLRWGNHFVDLSNIADHSITNAKLANTITDGPPGLELSYVQTTSNVTVTAIEGTNPPQTLVTSGSVTYDGTSPVIVEFFCGSVSSSAYLYVNGGKLATLGVGGAPLYGRLRLTPSAGAATITAAATVPSGSSGFSPSASSPMFIRISKA